MHLAIDSQATLGWKQLLYRWVSQSWNQMVWEFAPTTNSAHFFAKINHQAWLKTIAVWQVQNQHLYPPTMDTSDRTQLQVKVEKILYEVDQDPHLQQLLSNTTIEKILQ